jgi:hypothetical protein
VRVGLVEAAQGRGEAQGIAQVVVGEAQQTAGLKPPTAAVV